MSDSRTRPILACVLAGGTGTRLYPLSRPNRPKQFLEIGGDRSLLERTLERADRISTETWVLTNGALEEPIREHVRDTDARVLVEPDASGTGPALVYAAWQFHERWEGKCHECRAADEAVDGDESENRTGDPPVIVTLPSDHHIEDESAFARTLERAATVAADTEGLVTLGVEPTRAATEFGYIVPDSDDTHAAPGGGTEYTAVRRFREKPNREVARSLLEDGAYWNAGVFAWTPEALLEAARDSPLAPLVEALEAGVDPAEAFARVDPISIDEGVLERADDIAVVPLSVGWADLGTWDALGRLESLQTGDGNATLEGTTLTAREATDNVVAAPGKHVSLVGVDDLVVVAVDDRVLVVPREKAHTVRDLVGGPDTTEQTGE
ncbi:sugar phosphate nucleotidyltransferase [Halobacteria archaeon AArc-curdl1]|uniref:Sugar phosphate nucleotidyltransferase n=1 Tax=Natronosalvus hydrolyticus TaxID=2979988 RepID=A0AAP2Z6S9_9EURY|nr:sugar phosphate nucleotidyltransferase [Halobacteria archaeon AArc-curdl1]